MPAAARPEGHGRRDRDANRLGWMPVRTSAGIAVVLLALSAIVGLSMSSATVEEERLLGEFTTETRQQVHSSSPRRWPPRLHPPDMRMLADLVERSRQERQLDAATDAGSGRAPFAPWRWWSFTTG